MCYRRFSANKYIRIVKYMGKLKTHTRKVRLTKSMTNKSLKLTLQRLIDIDFNFTSSNSDLSTAVKS